MIIGRVNARGSMSLGERMLAPSYDVLTLLSCIVVCVCLCTMEAALRQFVTETVFEGREESWVDAVLEVLAANDIKVLLVVGCQQVRSTAYLLEGVELSRAGVLRFFDS